MQYIENQRDDNAQKWQIEIVLVNVMEGWTMDHGPGPVG